VHVRILLASALVLAPLVAGCASERRESVATPDARPIPMVGLGVGPSPGAASVDARRVLAGQLASLVGHAPPEFWSYIGVMRREGYPTAVSWDLLNLDRFDAAADEIGVVVRARPSIDARHRAEASIDPDRLLAAYAAEIDRADQAIARLSAERPVWGDEAWAGVERLIADIRTGRDYLVSARERVRARFSTP